VTRKVKESEDVTSFYLKPLFGEDQKLWEYKPGQHLPIRLVRGNNDVLMRTYSLSSGNNWGEYRISVKREPFGQASMYLHGEIEVGNRIQVSQPAGDFVLNQDSSKTLVLISAGVGVTPILSMLHSFVQTKGRKAVWVHGARDGKHHPFQHEVAELAELAGNSLKTHVVYSKPRENDMSYDSQGHINAELLKKLIPDLKNAEFYMCGTASFMADIEDGLEKLGVPSKSIQYETF
jgi:ferredoxin-NADP reductase